MPARLSSYSPVEYRQATYKDPNMSFGNVFRRKSTVTMDSQDPSNNKLSGLFRRLSNRSSKAEKQPSSYSTNNDGHNLVPPSFPGPSSRSSSPSSNMGSPSNTGGEAPPPSYAEAINPETLSTNDDPFAFLSNFDTVFLIDDSGSMAGRSWNETNQALAAIAPICAAHDKDGVDVYFLNNRSKPEYKHLKSAMEVREVFSTTTPFGPTPTGTALNSILRPYLRELESKGPDRVKPLNIIVITDGVPTDDPESVIIQAAKKLEKLDAPPFQVGIQFFQVGNEPMAAEALKDLDDGLEDRGCPRDIVDTVPYKSRLSADGMLKVVLGAVNRRLDRKKMSGESRRS